MKSRICLLTLLTAASAYATSVTTAGVDVVETFTTAPSSADWSTKYIAGTSGTFTTTAAIDTQITGTGFDATTGTSALVDGGTSYAINTSAQYRTDLGLAYTASTTSGVAAADTLIGVFTNNTGATLSGFTLSYDVSRVIPSAGPEQSNSDDVPGRSVFYSLTGTGTSWTKLTSISNTEVGLHDTFTTARPGGTTTGSATASESITGLNWTAGQNLYLLWVDDNAGGTDFVYTLDNLHLNAVSAIPEPSTYGLAGAGCLATASFIRRRRKQA